MKIKIPLTVQESIFDEFYEALSMEAHPRYNVIYADKEGNIMYLNNGLIPKRNDD